MVWLLWMPWQSSKRERDTDGHREGQREGHRQTMACDAGMAWQSCKRKRESATAGPWRVRRT